ncbi:unnamed protein product [Boreogadus saida]
MLRGLCYIMPAPGLQPFITGQPAKKVAVEQAPALGAAPGAAADPSRPTALAAVVESGPVVYDDAGDDEEDDDEEPCFSAMQLMGSNDYGCEGDYDEGF